MALSATEEKIKDATKATIRCIPFDAKEEHGSVYSYWESPLLKRSYLQRPINLKEKLPVEDLLQY